jgi:hypothetical protein
MIFLLPSAIAHSPKAAVYFTTSNGVSDSPGFPPIVPRIPEMLLINAKLKILRMQNYKIKAVPSTKYDCKLVFTGIVLFVNFPENPFPGNTA